MKNSTTKSSTRRKNTSPNTEKLISLGKPVNTGRVNKSTGYKGVHKIKYQSGKTMFRVRLMFEGVEYGSTHDNVRVAAEAYNKLAIKFYGKKNANGLNLLNVI